MINHSLTFDFSSGALDSRITFARVTSASNPATYANSSGVITAATNNQPRFDYDPVTMACRGLLIEESRTNRALASADMANATYWTATRASWPGTTTTAPDGSSAAQKLVEDATASATHLGLVVANIATVAGTTYTTSIYAKADGRNWFQLGEGQTMTAAAYFDVANGVVGNVTGTGSPSATITPVGGGWYRCTLTFTTTGTAARIRLYLATGNGAATYSGNGSSGIFFWGAQLEAGAFPTSYIPTTTTALTRNADVATITGSNFSSFWQAGKGGVLVRALPSTVSGTRPLVQVDDATADNIIALRGNTTNPELYIRSGGMDQATIDAGTISASAYRLAGAWAAGNAAASVNSGIAISGAPGAIPAATQARLGSDGTNYLNGHLQGIEYYDARVLNATLQVLSSSAGYRSIIGGVLRDSIIS